MPIKLGWDDLLIRDSSIDYGVLLGDWRWLLNGEFRVVVGSKFGDWFVERPDGRVELLDSIDGTVHGIAESTTEFYELLNVQKRQEEWLLSPLVLELHENGIIPGARECYGFKNPPILGGEVASDNVEVLDLTLWVSLCGQIHEQVHTLPEGSRISGFKEKPE